MILLSRRKWLLKSALGWGLMGGGLRPSFEGIGVATATEVLSTGAEMLVSKEKASQLLIRDPEHFAITLKGLTM